MCYVNLGFRGLVAVRGIRYICQHTTGLNTGRVIWLLAISHMVRNKFLGRIKVSFKNRLDKYMPGIYARNNMSTDHPASGRVMD